MNVGDYVRTENGIDKVAGYRYEPEYENGHVVYFEKSDSGCRFTDKNLPKSSPNIIDLIEVGDVITTNNLCGEITKIDGDKIYTTCYDGEYCSAKDIKSIVTKEMYSSVEYRVENN